MTPRFYSARLTKTGPIVGVKLFYGPPIVHGEELDRSHRLQCLVDLDPDGCFCWQLDARGAPVDVDGHTLRQVTPIDETEYRFLTARADWAQQWSPQHPSAKPRKAIDLRNMRSLF